MRSSRAENWDCPNEQCRNAVDELEALFRDPVNCGLVPREDLKAARAELEEARQERDTAIAERDHERETCLRAEREKELAGRLHIAQEALAEATRLAAAHDCRGAAQLQAAIATAACALAEPGTVPTSWCKLTGAHVPETDHRHDAAGNCWCPWTRCTLPFGECSFNFLPHEHRWTADRTIEESRVIPAAPASRDSTPPAPQELVGTRWSFTGKGPGERAHGEFAVTGTMGNGVEVAWDDGSKGAWPSVAEMRSRCVPLASRDSTRGTACPVWCGELNILTQEHQWCCFACEDAGKPLHPAPQSTRGTCATCLRTKRAPSICVEGGAYCNPPHSKSCPDCAQPEVKK